MKYNLYKHGFQKFYLNKKNFKNLNKIKTLTKNLSSAVIKKKIHKVENFHNLIKPGDNLNNIKLKIISELNKKKINNILFSILKENLIEIFGPDIAVQKKINLVIQRPFDPNYVTLHKDSPPNSPYELVVWIPLMNCKRTNAFKFLTIKDSKKIENMFKKNENEKKIKDFADKHSCSINTNFGEFIIFWTGVYHFSGLNSEKDTRWSLNLRYKNLFSPYGAKGFLDFFEPINYSKLTNLNINLK